MNTQPAPKEGNQFFLGILFESIRKCISVNPNDPLSVLLTFPALNSTDEELLSWLKGASLILMNQPFREDTAGTFNELDGGNIQFGLVSIKECAVFLEQSDYDYGLTDNERAIIEKMASSGDLQMIVAIHEQKNEVSTIKSSYETKTVCSFAQLDLIQNHFE